MEGKYLLRIFNQKKLRAIMQTPGDDNKHRESKSVVEMDANKDKKIQLPTSL